MRHESNAAHRRRITPPAALAAVGLLALVVITACRHRGPGPIHGWWDERGPVIPHDTFPSDCTLCHTGGDWTTLRDDFAYDHAAETGVALEGAHARAQCLRCHNDRGPVEIFAARGCAGCHEDVHQAQLGANCTDCHGETDWRPRGIIEEHARTRFPLVGAHAATACWRCHPGAQVGRFTPTDVECATCHGDDLARATDPDHFAQGWTQDCDRCHIPTTWTGGGFNHGFFPLTGKHRTLDCEACHVGGDFGGLPTACVGCHQADYDGANDPDHVGLGFPLACQRCHTTQGWTRAEMDHSWITAACSTCHLGEYQNADDPDHQGLGFPLECQICHGTKTWFGADMDHGWVTDTCVTCHLADYQSTTDPDHQAAGFPLECETCHGTNKWSGATFDHDFPIDSGNHKNLGCAECHIVPNNFMVFTCTDCHEHQKGDMDDEHDDVRDYVYDTPACYSCHPNGKE